MSEYNFSLPRLLAHCRGRPAHRTERNWTEANVVGALVHLVVYVFAFDILLAGLPAWQGVFLSIPLAFGVWIFWLLVLYLDSLTIRLLRACGFLRTMSDIHAQSFLICTITTVCAVQLLLTASWTRFIGVVWIALVALNLFAALLLLITNDSPAAAK